MNLSFSKMISKLISTIFKPQNQPSNNDFAIAVDQAPNQNMGYAQDTVYKISQKGMQLISNFEGLRLNAYQDSVGVWTIGFGTTVFPHGKSVQDGDCCTIQQAEAYMLHDLARFENAVSKVVIVPLQQHQFDALVSLAYNIGIRAFQNSTLVKLLNTGDYLAASQQFDVWIKAGGRTVQGLVNRRAIEKTLFLGKHVQNTFHE